MKIFIGLMILVSVIVFVVFGFSVKYALYSPGMKEASLVDEEISRQIPSVMDSIKSSISEIFKAKEEMENVEDIKVQAERGYKLPVTR